MSKKEQSHHGPADTGGQVHQNETLNLLHMRSSCRSFHDRPIPEEVLHDVLLAGRHAATGGNLQPFSIVKITDPEAQKKLAKWNHQEFIATAPVDLLFCLDFRCLKRWAVMEKAPFTGNYSFRHFWIAFQDVIIAAQNICTAADALDLGSVYIGTVTDCVPELRDLLELPELVYPVVLLCLGYPKDRPSPRKKLPLEILVHEEKYRDVADSVLLEAYGEKYSHPGFEATAERLETLTRSCTVAHGPEFAEMCLRDVNQRGNINMVQRYFGLHYTVDGMPEGNPEFLKLMEECGFHWFKEFRGPVDPPIV